MYFSIGAVVPVPKNVSTEAFYAIIAIDSRSFRPICHQNITEKTVLAFHHFCFLFSMPLSFPRVSFGAIILRVLTMILFIELVFFCVRTKSHIP